MHLNSVLMSLLLHIFLCMHLFTILHLFANDVCDMYGRLYSIQNKLQPQLDIEKPLLDN